MRSFRNLADAAFEPPARGLVLVGPNGHGKTSLLEALLYPEVFRSFRGARDREVVRFGEDGFHVAVEMDGSAAEHSDVARGQGPQWSPEASAPGTVVSAGYDARTGEKRVTLNGVVAPRLADAIGAVRGVVFSPSDVQLATGGAAVRRRYLDVLLSLTVPGYVETLAEYRRAVRHRSRVGAGAAGAAGAAGGAGGAGTDVEDWEALVARAGARIAAARRGWVERWAPRYGEHCVAIGEASGTAGLGYASRGTESEGDLAAALARSRERDLARGTTSVGPHRDDLRLLLGERSLATYGSAGQWRTAALALRLIEAETLAETDGRGGGRAGGRVGGGGGLPAICLDDAFAELDEERSMRLGRLVEALASRGSQVFATVPREREMPEALSGLARWRVRRGHLEAA